MLKTTSGWCFRVHHGTRQQSLVDWKYAELAQFVRSAPRRSGSGYYLRTVTHPWLTEIREQFYIGDTKVVPIDLLRRDLSDFGLAVWIMDDGAADGNQLRLNTQGFTVDETAALASLIRAKFGIEMSINLDKGKPRLRCNAASMERLVGMVREHLVPDMLYKLSL